MAFSPVTSTLIEQLTAVVGAQYVFSDAENRSAYGHDETEDLNHPPEVVVKPGNTEEVAAVVALCHAANVPVTPVGGRTGLSGGALSIHGGVAVAMERFNRILEIDEQNLQATVEPGVITQVFQEAVIERGLFYPPDPSSRGSCFCLLYTSPSPRDA